MDQALAENAVENARTVQAKKRKQLQKIQEENILGNEVIRRIMKDMEHAILKLDIANMKVELAGRELYSRSKRIEDKKIHDGAELRGVENETPTKAELLEFMSCMAGIQEPETVIYLDSKLLLSWSTMQLREAVQKADKLQAEVNEMQAEIDAIADRLTESRKLRKTLRPERIAMDPAIQPLVVSEDDEEGEWKTQISKAIPPSGAAPEHKEVEDRLASSATHQMAEWVVEEWARKTERLGPARFTVEDLAKALVVEMTIQRGKDAARELDESQEPQYSPVPPTPESPKFSPPATPEKDGSGAASTKA